MKITLLGDPKTKKNSMQITRHGVIQSRHYLAYEKSCGWQLARYKPDEPIDYPVNVQCVYYRQTKRRVDLTNLLSATCDILVKFGILADDNRDIVVSHDRSIVLYDKANPRVEIEILPVYDYLPWKKK